MEINIKRHRRSISQLIGASWEFLVEDMAEMGTTNPALSESTENEIKTKKTNESLEKSSIIVADLQPSSTEEDDDDNNANDIEYNEDIDSTVGSKYLGDGILSADSEFDEGLGIPDSITIVSMGDGDKPILVERTTQNGDDDDEEEEEIDLTSMPVNINIPITAAYNAPIKFKSFKRNIFIPCHDVDVQITDNERSLTTHLLNPNLYTIELKHGEFVWTIKKRYKHFHALHQQLQIFRTSLNLPLRSQREKRASFRQSCETTITSKIEQKQQQEFERKQQQQQQQGNILQNRIPIKIRRKRKLKKKKSKLPRFPKRPETLVTVEALPSRIKQLEEYLYNLLNISLYRNHYETINFLEVSNISFISGLGQKGKEGPIRKRTGSTRAGQSGCNCFGCFHRNCCVRCNYFCSDVLCGKWRNRWFFVKETFFGYIRPSDGEIRAVVLFDQGFDVSTGIYSTGMRNGLQILTNNRHIMLKCWTRRKSKEWTNYLKQVANSYARDFTCPNPHMSFAPTRSSIQAHWFVDGSSYMSSIADALEAATEEIYIADWWLSPEIYMKRPAINGDYWRLDKILQRKAEQGVRIFILLYKEVEMALGINSYYSKQRLVNTHSNIKVIRHPDHAKVGVFLWAHHEKIVVIDQSYAFLGGIDLCYGRWDDFRHRLTDLGSVTTSSSSSNLQRKSNGFFNHATVKFENSNQKSSSNNDNVDFQRSENSLPKLLPGDKLLMPSSTSRLEKDQIIENMKQNTPEMERKKVLDKLKDNVKDNVRKGRIVMRRLTSLDIGNVDENTNKDQQNQQNLTEQQKQLVFSDAELEDGRKGIGYEDPTPFQTNILNDLDGQAKFWFGKDYTNFIMKDFVNLDAPYVDLVDRTSTPRMPWHDVGVVVLGATARDVARHFIQRWNATKLEKTRDNQSFPYLMPKTYNDIKLFEKNLNLPFRRVTCQVLRSVSSWSCGFLEQDLVEQSIHDAYIETITKAQHYIYIENQFFISLQLSGAGFGSSVRNQIAETLFKRIVRAHKERKTFRVYIIMPLLPGFEGDVGGTSGNALRAITHWNYASISRGKSSILQRLKEIGIKDPSQYISFHSLRNHSILNNYPITELIYVHSKLLIADDRVVICGSANINDRSMIGKRDSEIAVLITDEEYENGRMNGNSFPSGVFAGRLRKYLFREHLGLLEPDPNRKSIDVTDPVIDNFWNGTWKRISETNTRIYDEVFKCIPTDNVLTFSNLRKYQEEPPLCKTNPELAFERIKSIQGHLVYLPLEFLNSEILTPPGVSKEGLIPTSVWT